MDEPILYFHTKRNIGFVGHSFNIDGLIPQVELLEGLQEQS